MSAPRAAQAPRTLVKVQREDFDVGAELDARVGAMTLEHFPGMTERELERISAEAHARWPLEATLVVHRFGRLEP
ncbi:MAG: molybdenum cofactor biosynthesis protein MoaE, partial [Alphaproteobacteria bacterium]